MCERDSQVLFQEVRQFVETVNEFIRMIIEITDKHVEHVREAIRESEERGFERGCFLFTKFTRTS